MGEEQNTTNPEILKLLNKIVSQNDDIKKDIETIKKDLSIQSLKIDNINIKVAALEEENLELKQKLIEIERKTRRNNFIIFGINEDVTDTLSFVIDIIKDKLHIAITRNEINNIYRLGQKVPGKIRPLLLELVTCLKKQEISKELYKLKNTGIIFSNDLLPQDREEQKVLHYHLKLAKQKQYNAKIIKNKLIINGETYSYQDLTSINTENTQNKKQNKNNSAPATPQANTVFIYTTEEDKKQSKSGKSKEAQTEVNKEKEPTKIRKDSTSTPGTYDSSSANNKRTNNIEDKEYVTRSSKKQKV